MKTDTIAAIATAPSDSGIGIIRISGTEAIQVADTIFRTKSGKKKLSTVDSHTVHYGYIVDIIQNKYKNKDNLENNCDWMNTIVDEVMVAVFKAPRSYTTEDTVEINCHGGVLVMQKILETVIKAGARMAEPGEFTKRAFLNGRIDLSKAEAVMDVIHSQNEYALASSMSQLKGNLSKEIKSLREKVIYEIAFIESALDDPEHISLEGYPEKLSVQVDELCKKIEKLISTADNGRLMKEGIATVIVGKPNAGKSSLLNIMVGEERAIVTDIAGTTRDILEEHVKLHGIGLNIIDTAGIRDTDDTVEKIGVERAKAEAEGADFVIYVADASRELDENDEAVISMIHEKKSVVLLNKSDLSIKVTKEELEEKTGKQVFLISAKEETGMDAFAEAVEEMFYSGLIDKKEEVFITNLRHKQALLEAKESLEKVMDSLALDMPEDFYSIDLMNAYQMLGEIIGEAVDEDLVDTIFKEFCMGK